MVQVDACIFCLDILAQETAQVRIQQPILVIEFVQFYQRFLIAAILWVKCRLDQLDTQFFGWPPLISESTKNFPHLEHIRYLELAYKFIFKQEIF